ncbi:DUF4105 domain-containing protein [Vibrio sonorensis]|uniref:Lnb N-terminal periplasmic domain-containing protein n=1 Tax=Vibrio sonorensis TaxID=1004316 RepID=UPI0008D9917C|nr:DUF4105 domain-containing protein [Vibrio sonorensis]
MTLTSFYKALLISSGLALAPNALADSFNIGELSENSYWHKLGHYLPASFGGVKSTIDSPSFFLSPAGKHDPKSELVATIDALYHKDPLIANDNRCQYPARYTWLEAQQGRNAKLNCPELNDWKTVLDPAGMTLVFPTAFMNNPSSMFGHTLLRVDAKDQTRHKELVAFAINFAAEPETDDNAALYAIKGLVGSYPGRFTVMPYYRKVREYNDIESRDIWEYKLKLSEQEVERVLLHLWEMQHAEFDYYFIDENCSYQLLSLIELAREELSLVADFPLHAIPSDTVETLANNDLLEEPSYREAFGTRLLYQSEAISPDLFDAAVAAKNGQYPDKDDYTDQERAAILEFAYEWLNFELYDLGLERDPTAKRLTELLYQRSRIKVDSPFGDVPVPEVSPEKGHASARFGLGFQSNKFSNDKVTLEWRAAYHDLLDSQAGFIPGAQISFLDTQLTIDEESNTRLDRFYFLDAMALAPSNKVFDSLAWNIRFGYDRQPTENKMAGRWFGQGGFGKAWGESDGLHLYSLLSASVSGGELTNYDAVAGAGIEMGILYQVSDNHRVGLQGQYLALIDSPADQHAQAKASWHWTLDRNVAVRAEASYQHWHAEEVSGKITGYFYY